MAMLNSQRVINHRIHKLLLFFVGFVLLWRNAALECACTVYIISILRSVRHTVRWKVEIGWRDPFFENAFEILSACPTVCCDVPSTCRSIMQFDAILRVLNRFCDSLSSQWLLDVACHFLLKRVPADKSWEPKGDSLSSHAGPKEECLDHFFPCNGPWTLGRRL